MTLLLSADHLNIVNAVCYCLSIGFILIHTYGRYRFFGKPLTFASDYFLVTSVLTFLLFESILDHYLGSWGFYDPSLVYTKSGGLPLYEKIVTKEHIRNGLKMSFAKGPLYMFAVYCIKMTFLLTYKRLFNPRKETRKSPCLWINVTMGITTLGYVASIGFFLFWCQPMSRNWSLDPKDRCLSTAGILPFFFSTGAHLISDIIIYILPFFFLPSSSSSDSDSGQRWNLLAVRLMFSLGFLCILITVVRLVFTSAAAVPAVMVAFMSAELTAPQILACLPMVRRLWMSRSQPHDSAISTVEFDFDKADAQHSDERGSNEAYHRSSPQAVNQ